MGGPQPIVGRPLHTRLRYFDLQRHRPGLPEDVGALVDTITATETGVHLVNVNQLEPREVVVQAGTYGEHNWTSVSVDGAPPDAIDGTAFTVLLEPGTGAYLTLGTDRYVNQPSGAFPFV